jgi:hypothetical protein
MIPGLDTVLVGEVEEHALAVPLPPPTCSPFSICECGYGNFVFELDKGCSWRNTVGSLMEVSPFLTVLCSLENSLCFEFLILKVGNSLCEVADFNRGSAICFLKGIFINCDDVSCWDCWRKRLLNIRGLFLFFFF